MKFINKSLLFIFFLIGAVLSAQEQPPAPPFSGGEASRGGVGPGGAPPSPIDMYEYFLVFIALFIIVYYTRKLNRKIA